MAINVGGAYGKIVIDASGAIKGTKDATKGVESFIGALKNGGGDMKSFTNQLMVAGKAAGLHERELFKMARATGAYSDQQLLAARTSSAMTAKANELARAVANNQMTTRQAGAAFAQFAKEQGVAGSGATNLMGIFNKAIAVIGGVATAAAIAGAALKTAFDLGKQGAVVLQTTESWQQLLETVGAAPDLLQQLRDASNGTISDLQLMSATATLLAGTSGEFAKSLANAAPEIMEVAKAANKLNPALGTTEQMYTSLMTGIKRGSPLLIDNTGLTVKIGEANQKMAASLGKSVEQLTAEEQKMALLNATMEAGQTLIKQVGGNTDSATDSIAAMETAVANLGNAWKSKLAPYVSNVANVFTLALTASDKITAALQAQEQATYQTARSYGDYLEEMLRASVAAGRTKKEHMDALLLYRERGIAIDDQVEALGILTESEFNAARSGEYLQASYEANKGAAEDFTAAVEESSDAVQRMNDDLIASGREGGLSSAQANAEAASWAFKEMTKRTREAGEEIQSLDEIAAGLTFEDLGSALSGGIANMIEGLNRELAGGGRIAAMMEQTKQAVLAGKITPEEGREYFAGLLVASEQLEVDLGNKTQWEAKQFVQEALGIPMDEVTALFDQMPTDIENALAPIEDLDVEGVADKLADIKDAQAGMGEASDTTNPKLAEQADELGLIKDAAEGLPEVLGEVTTGFSDMGSAMTTSGLIEGLRAFEGIGQEALDLSAGMEGFVDAASKAPEPTRQTAEAIMYLRDEVNEAQKDVRDLSREMNGLTASSVLARSRVNMLRAALAALPSGKTIKITVDIQQKGGLPGGLGITIPNLHDEGTGGPGGRAAGGPVLRGQPVVWNERGALPEVLIPSGNGYVLNRQQAEAALVRAASSGGQAPGGAGAVSVQNVEQHFYSQGAAALGMAIVARDRWSRLNAGMGY